MTKDVIHNTAQGDTPETVNVPSTWPALIVWAISRWGPGILGFILLIPVYQDLKASNERTLQISQSNIQVLNNLAQKVEDGNVRTARVEEAIRRLESKQ